MSIKDDFAEAFLKAMPKGDKTMGATIAAMGSALETILASQRRPDERHTHYHVPEGSVLNAVGDLIRIEPWQPEVRGNSDPVKISGEKQ